MSREHKYRAWDKDCEVMYYSDKENEDCIFGFHEGRVVAWLRETEPQTLDEPAYDYGKPVDVEQYTGLKDKDGVEICEGDIIRFWWRQDEKWGPPTPVEMKAYCPSGDDRIMGWWADDSPVTENCEVIGNVHQHPELLEQAAIAKGTVDAPAQRTAPHGQSETFQSLCEKGKTPIPLKQPMGDVATTNWVDGLTLRQLCSAADRYDIPHNESQWLDDDYPDKTDELRVAVAEAMEKGSK